MATGEAQRLTYEPGMERPRTLPIDSGDYKADLESYGKKGLKGWTRKPMKYPNRRVVFRIQGTEDEIDGGEKKLSEYLTTHPKAFFRIFDLAKAVGYPEKIDVPLPKKETSPEVRMLCEEIDKLLEYIEENNISINVEIGQEDYQGNTKSRIVRWLPPDDGIEPADDDGFEASEDDEEEEVTEDEDDTEEEEPVKPASKKNGATKAKATVTKKRK